MDSLAWFCPSSEVNGSRRPAWSKPYLVALCAAGTSHIGGPCRVPSSFPLRCLWVYRFPAWLVGDPRRSMRGLEAADHTWHGCRKHATNAWSDSIGRLRTQSMHAYHIYKCTTRRFPRRAPWRRRRPRRAGAAGHVAARRAVPRRPLHPLAARLLRASATDVADRTVSQLVASRLWKPCGYHPMILDRPCASCSHKAGRSSISCVLRSPRNSRDGFCTVGQGCPRGARPHPRPCHVP